MDAVKIFSTHWRDEFQVLQHHVSVVDFGTEVCLIKKEKLVPSASVALCTDLNSKNFHSVEVNEKQALHYLRRESWAVEAPVGYALITYQNIPLGWINNLGNRSNNLFPNEWRLRK